MGLGIITLITALSISAVAIYYSVAGLVAIFAAAAIPIIVMGSVLEIAKLVTAVWLHYYWEHAVWWLKTYLTVSVVVLMLITSMGIFGFLSKAHIDQTASAKDGLARLEQIDSQILRQQDVIVKAEQEINELETAGTNRDAEIQAQIDKEQDRIDSAYTRIQPAIDEQNVIITKEEQRLTGGLSIYEDQLIAVNDNLQKIEQYIASGSIKELQALVGVKADGSLGPATRSAIEAFRVAQSSEKQRLAELIASERSKLTSPVIDAARAEIQRLRSLAEQEIANSNELINRLRQQLGKTDADQIAVEVEKQNTIIDRAEQEITALTEQKFGLESEYRKLEAEVGPIKYLAEFVYGKSEDKDLLEEAVRWVIVLIIFVFDPLAVLLLIASQHTFNFQRELRIKATLLQSNVASTKDIENDVSTRPDNEQSDTKTPAAKDVDAEPSVANSTDNGTSQDAVLHDSTGTSDNGGDIAVNLDEQQRRIELLEHKEQDEEYKNQKQAWKAEYPDQTVKFWKDQYIKGKVDKLPWEDDLVNNE